MQEFGDTARPVQLVIMTSEDTHDKTVSLLKAAAHPNPNPNPNPNPSSNPSPNQDWLFRWFGQRVWAVNRDGSRNLGYAS